MSTQEVKPYTFLSGEQANIKPAQLPDIEKSHGNNDHPGMVWLVIGSNRNWAKSFHLKDAWNEAGKPKAFMIFHAHACLSVDAYGYISGKPIEFPRWADGINDLYRFVGQIIIKR